MTANMEPIYWRSNKDWYTYDAERDEFKMTDKAPERAVKSFELWNQSGNTAVKSTAV